MDGPLGQDLERKVTDSEMSSLIEFHGHIDHVACYITSLDVLVMCSDHEGLPMTLLEAMALGVPVVGHNVGAMRALLGNNVGGLLSEEHSSTYYAKGVQELLADKKLLCSVIRDGQKAITKDYSAGVNKGKTLNLYKSILR